MAASQAHPLRFPRIAPSGAPGWAALAVFGVSLLLLLGRLLLAPLLRLPISFLVVVIGLAAAGAVALLAVVLLRERGLSVFAVLAVGATAAALLAAEAMGGGGEGVTVNLGEGDDGGTVNVPVGAQLVLQLPGNPGTGYAWEVSIGDGSVLKQDGEPVFKASSGALGASGTYRFVFEAPASGRSDLTLVYRRPWETDVEPLRTYTVTVVAG